MPFHHVPIEKRCRRDRGMSLLEMLVVLGILMTLTGISIPPMLTVISNVRLHGGISILSGVLQNCRMLAVKENQSKTTRFTVLANGPVAYIKSATSSAPLATSDPQAQLGSPLMRYITPTGADAPPALTSAQLTFTAETSDLSFNSRGFPCAFSGGVCVGKGFVFYFGDRRLMGRKGWAAVSVSPAGRIRRWIWSGSSWQ
jgi:prepilin-type N-terminal cleavage/methylation domain-containing protein